MINHKYIHWLLNLLCVLLIDMRYIVLTTLAFMSLKYKRKTYLISFLFMLLYFYSGLLSSMSSLLFTAVYELFGDYNNVIKKICTFKDEVDQFISLSQKEYPFAFKVKNIISGIYSKTKIVISYITEKFNGYSFGTYLNRADNYIDTFINRFNYAPIINNNHNSDAEEPAITLPQIEEKPDDSFKMFQQNMDNLSQMLKTVEDLQKVMGPDNTPSNMNMKSRKFKRKLKKFKK